MQYWPQFHFWPGGRNPTASATCGLSLSIWGFLPGMLMLLSAFCPSLFRHWVRLAVCPYCGCKKKKVLLLLHFFFTEKHKGGCYRSGSPTSCYIRQHLYVSSALFCNFIAVVCSCKDRIVGSTFCLTVFSCAVLFLFLAQFLYIKFSKTAECYCSWISGHSCNFATNGKLVLSCGP